MPKFAIHNAAGEVLRVLDVPEEELAKQLAPGEVALKSPTVTIFDKVNTKTKKIVVVAPPTPPAPPPPPPDYVDLRKQLYLDIASQLDLLWHAMDIGEIPKATAFYDRIKLVKDAVPKTVGIDPIVIHQIEALPNEETE
jgi:hypothetical protein